MDKNYYQDEEFEEFEEEQGIYFEDDILAEEVSFEEEEKSSGFKKMTKNRMKDAKKTTEDRNRFGIVTVLFTAASSFLPLFFCAAEVCICDAFLFLAVFAAFSACVLYFFSAIVTSVSTDTG